MISYLMQINARGAIDKIVWRMSINKDKNAMLLRYDGQIFIDDLNQRIHNPERRKERINRNLSIMDII